MTDLPEFDDPRPPLKLRLMVQAKRGEPRPATVDDVQAVVALMPEPFRRYVYMGSDAEAEELNKLRAQLTTAEAARDTHRGFVEELGRVHSQLQDLVDDAFGPVPTAPCEKLIGILKSKVDAMKESLGAAESALAKRPSLPSDIGAFPLSHRVLNEAGVEPGLLVARIEALLARERATVEELSEARAQVEAIRQRHTHWRRVDAASNVTAKRLADALWFCEQVQIVFGPAPTDPATAVADGTGTPVYYCAGKSCPGLPNRASDVPHPLSCNGDPTPKGDSDG